MDETIVRDLDWVDPLWMAAGLAGRDGLLCLISDGEATGRRSFVAVDPDRFSAGPLTERDPYAALKGPGMGRNVLGLLSYDAGARAATGTRPTVWPDLTLARYPAMLVFDHDRRRLTAVGAGDTPTEAGAACDRASVWVERAVEPERPVAPSRDFSSEADAASYLVAVADVVDRIAAGELFQANIARAWAGTLTEGADPFDVFLRLAGQGGAPYAAYWSLGERALVSNSPELFLAWNAGTARVETRPIKGTRARDADPEADAALAADLSASVKDRAENLMIVDLMRNDLARVCEPGSVAVETLFDIESHPTVHHLVSTVSGRTVTGCGPAALLEATFPPGSITGAPKHQAMKVIAGHEPPRGAWCGSLFLLDASGGLTASVLIRTASFQKTVGLWHYRTLAGAGIVADSVPDLELAETEVKISALKAALIGQAGQSLQPTV